MQYQRPAKLSIVDSIIESIKQAMRERKLVPGQRLPEADLKEITGAGRSSIREALRRLTAEGLVELTHQKGARIRRIRRDEALSVYQVRIALEGLAARLAAENIDRKDYRLRLLELEKSFDDGGDQSPKAYLDYNHRFHRLVVQMSENPYLADIFAQLELPAFLMILEMTVGIPSATRSRKEHRPIVQAILKGQANKAEQAMQAHIQRTAEHIATDDKFSI